MSSIYLGNLSWNLDEATLGDAIAEVAQPTHLEIKFNKYGRSLGYAIAQFDNDEDAQAVIAALHGAELDGRKVNCREDRGERAKPAPAATNRIFVGNLSWDLDDDALLELFSEFNVVSANVQRRGGSSKGWALVEFGSAQDAQDAIAAMNGIDVDGRDIVCHEDRGTPARGNNQRQPREPRQPRQPRVLAAGPPSPNVFIGNLNWDVNDAALDELLSGFDVQHAEVQTRPDGKSRGYALATFGSVEEAQRAIDDLNGQEVMERPLLLKFDNKQ